jgi:NADPH-dependent glutamate synthase beta subunit-like oxidoreductase/ferredoxin
MVTLTIDDRSVSVDEGTTILDAARSLGIRIPTLCKVDGYPAAASCFLCAVRIDGKATLTPSCAVPVAQGMVVRTDTDELRASRKMALELLLSDHVGDCVGPCTTACPARFDIPGFLSRVAEGDDAQAAAVAADFLTLPAALGRVCPRLCEQRCNRCDSGDSVSIGSLHRFAADNDLASASRYVPRRAASTGKRVSIVGAGPSGLTAAYHLLRGGHDVSVLDAHDEPGGMLRFGIPAFRLPPEVLAKEIAVITALGGQFRMKTRLGRDVSLEMLRRESDAVFLAIGAQASRGLDCPGEALALPAVELLAEVAAGRRPLLGDRVLVVGGGNTAMDVARSAVRLGAEVTVLYRRTRREMPCLMAEVEAAEAEGVRIEFLVAPVGLERTDAGLRLTCQRMVLGEPDRQGRPRPVPVAGSDFALEASAVVSAVGQVVEGQACAEAGLRMTPRGIAVNPVTLATNLDGVFAGGDGVTGADLAVRAVAAGKLAASSIDQYLGGRPVVGHPEMISVVMGKLDERELAEFFRGIEASTRVTPPQLPLERRLTSFDEVEPALSPDVARQEARRCMRCGCFKASNCQLRQYATEYGADPSRFLGARRKFRRDGSHPEVVYEPGKCILCGACVAVAERAGDGLGLAIVGRGFDAAVAVPLRGTLVEALPAVARDVVAVCPTGAFALKGEGGCCRLLPTPGEAGRSTPGVPRYGVNRCG